MFINYAGREVWLSDDQARQVSEAIDRYLGRHGEIPNPAPLPRDRREDMRQTILADAMSADWSALSLTHYGNTGRWIFPDEGTPMDFHLRAARFMAGRARVRRWHGEDEGAELSTLRPRASTDFSGAGMGSRTAAPDTIVSAIESAAGGLWAVPDRSLRSRRRQVRTRRSHSYIITVVARHPDRTSIQIERVTVHNFRTAGSVPNRETVKSRKRLPEGTTPAELREALQG
jgi:hypothetical protein